MEMRNVIPNPLQLRQLCDEIQASKSSTVPVSLELQVVFPKFIWVEGPIWYEATLVNPTYKITQLNKLT